MLTEEEIRHALHASRVVPIEVANPHGPLGLEQLAAAVARGTADAQSQAPKVHYLRLCAPILHVGSVGFERGIVYTALGLEDDEFDKSTSDNERLYNAAFFSRTADVLRQHAIDENVRARIVVTSAVQQVRAGEWISCRLASIT